MSYKLQQKHDFQRNSYTENNGEFCIKSRHLKSKPSLAAIANSVSIKVSLTTHEVVHSDHIVVDSESLPASELSLIDSDEDADAEDLTPLTALACTIAAAINQLPSSSKSWIVYLDDLNETKAKRFERIQRKSESLLQFMKRFPVTELTATHLDKAK